MTSGSINAYSAPFDRSSSSAIWLTLRPELQYSSLARSLASGATAEASIDAARLGLTSVLDLKKIAVHRRSRTAKLLVRLALPSEPRPSSCEFQLRTAIWRPR